MPELNFYEFVGCLLLCVLVGMICAYPVGYYDGKATAEKKAAEARIILAYRWREVTALCTKRDSK